MRRLVNPHIAALAVKENAKRRQGRIFGVVVTITGLGGQREKRVRKGASTCHNWTGIGFPRLETFVLGDHLRARGEAPVHCAPVQCRGVHVRAHHPTQSWTVLDFAIANVRSNETYNTTGKGELAHACTEQ